MQQRPIQPSYRDQPPRRLPARRARGRQRPNRDRWYLAGTIAIVGLSLLAFAALEQPAPTSTNPVVIPPLAASPTAAATPPTAPAEDTETANRPLVCLDVGHGGVDLGKVRTNEDDTEILALEKDLVLDQALELRDRLEAQGVAVVLTRETDTEVNATFEDVNGDGEIAFDPNGDGEIDQRLGEYPDELDELQARVNVCNRAGADLLVSLHINGAENLDLKGYEAWYAEDDALGYVEESAEFANLVVQHFGEQFEAAGYETVSRGAAPDSMLFLPDADQGTFDHLVMLSPDVPARNYVGADMPVVIVECLFVSNDDDYAFLTEDPELAQDAIVSAYEAAILAFFADELAGDDGREGVGEVALQSFGGPGATAEASPARSPAAATEEAEESAGATPTPRPEPLPDNGETAQVHYFGDGGRKEIALTFDLGSDRGYAEEILDFLKEHGIKATFGVTGHYVEENPDLIERMVAEGHQLINHTYDHRSFTGESPNTDPLTSAERVETIERTHDLVLDLTGYDMRPYFRLPYGDGAADAGVARDVYAAGYYLTIMWTCDTNGWKEWPPARIIEHCSSAAKPGDIILMHVGVRGTDQDALPGLVEVLEKDGYEFVTVEEILLP